MSKTYILGSARTAIGKFGGSLAGIQAHTLGSIAVRAAVERAGIDPAEVDEVILGNVLMAGQGQGPGRQAALGAGIPESVPAWAINQLCGSGLKTVCLAATAIAAGEGDLYIAGGMENMSIAPYLAPSLRNGAKYGHTNFEDSILTDGLTDVFSGDHMGMTAEALVDMFSLTREEQDQFALASQKKAAEAIASGRFAEEIAPVAIPQRKGDPILFSTDEHGRADTTLESLTKLRPAFKKDGSVTAGNSSGINDGAAALVLASQGFVDRTGRKPEFAILGHGTTALKPYHMGLGPVEAGRKALARAGLKVSDIDLFEFNEAFAAQSLAVVREFGADPAKVNVNGGAIALGHPIGASGARILVSLVHEMKRRKVRFGLAGLCVGGGMGVAAVVENLSI